MALSADPYDPWNATVQSAAVGAGWRADVRRSDADGAGLLNLDRTERASAFEYLVRDQTSETPQSALNTSSPGNNGAEAGNPDAGEETPWFHHLLDVINPLQHIPVVSTVYRELSGDEIGAVPRVAGGTLFFGPLGTLSALANIAVEEQTGQDIGEHVMAWFDDEPEAATVADVAPFTDADVSTAPTAAAFAPAAAPQPASQGLDPAGTDPLAMALLSNQQGVAQALQPTAAQQPIRLADASSTPAPASVSTAKADAVVGMPAAMVEALQTGGGVQALSPNGFAFPGAPASAAAVPPPKPDAAAGEPLQAVNVAAQADAVTERVVLDAQADRDALVEAVHNRPAGSTAAEGGWFSTTMLNALNHYETTRDLTARGPAPTVDVSN
jgi:hypothetical protein